MTIAKTKIGEHDSVALTEQHGRWPAGTRGCALNIWNGYVDVEIPASGGRVLDLLVVSEDQLRVISKSPALSCGY
jgi:hypothetical protein